MIIKISRHKMDELFGVIASLKIMTVDAHKGKEVVQVPKAWPIKFLYFMKRNTDALTTEFRAAMAKESELLSAYYTERQQVVQGLAKKDGEGKPVIEKGNYVVEDEAALKVEVGKLAEKYKDKIKEWEDYTNAEIDFEGYGINLSDAEDVGLPASAFDVLAPLIIA